MVSLSGSNDLSAWVLISGTASFYKMLQTKNIITGKNELISNKWYFHGFVACKDVSLLNYFAVWAVQLCREGLMKSLLWEDTGLIFHKTVFAIPRSNQSMVK